MPCLTALLPNAQAIKVLPTPVGPTTMRLLWLLIHSFWQSLKRPSFVMPRRALKSISSKQAEGCRKWAWEVRILSCLFSRRASPCRQEGRAFLQSPGLYTRGLFICSFRPSAMP